MRRFLIVLIKSYKLTLSPMLATLFGKGCRFMPTCSDYTITAIDRHGCISGGKMAIKRILKCHPFSKSGADPVPEIS